MYIIILYCIPFVQGIFSVILVCKFKKYEFFKPPPNLIHAWIKTHMLRLWRLIVGSPHAGGIRVNVVGEHSDGLQSGDSHCVDEVGLVGFQEGPVSRQMHVQHILNSNVQVHVDYQTIFSLSFSFKTICKILVKLPFFSIVGQKIQNTGTVTIIICDRHVYTCIFTNFLERDAKGNNSIQIFRS